MDLYLWATSDLPQQIPMLEQTEHTLANIDKLLAPAGAAQTAKAPSTSSESSANDKELVDSQDYFATESGSGEIS